MFRTQGYMMIQSTRDLANCHEWNEANLFNFSHHLHSSFNSSQKIRSRGPRILKSLFFLPKVRTSVKSSSSAFIVFCLSRHFTFAPDPVRLREAPFPSTKILAQTRLASRRFRARELHSRARELNRIPVKCQAISRAR
jgi:hypothetical protein